MAKSGTLVVRFIGDLKEFQASSKQMGTSLALTGKQVSAGITKPLGDANTAVTTLGKGFKTETTGIGRSIDSGITQPVKDVATAVGGVGAGFKSEMAKVDSAVNGTSASVKGLDSDIVAVSGAVKGVGSDFTSEMRRVDSSVEGSRRELSQFSSDLKQIKSIKVSPEIDETKIDSGLAGLVSKVKSQLGEAGKEGGSALSEGLSGSLSTSLKGGLAGVGVVAGAALAAGILEGMDIEAATDKLAASLALSAIQAKRAGEVASHLYAGAWGDSMEEVTAAVGAVMSSIPNMARASSKQLEGVTADALNFAAAFDIDITRAVQIAGQTVRQGFAKNASGAFDLLVSASQRVPVAVREDLLDAIDEYEPFFKTLGLSGEQAFGILTEAAKKGMYGIDKAGDAIKEFTIRVTDGSTPVAGAFETIGLSQKKMEDAILSGGKSANKAFNQIVDGLLAIQDPSDQSAAALALFGTPMEDLNVSEIPKFLEGLQASSAHLGKVQGSAKRMGDELNDNTKTSFTSFTRQLKTEFVGAIQKYVMPSLNDFSRELMTDVGPALKDTQGTVKEFTTLTKTLWGKWGDDITSLNHAMWGRLTGSFTDKLRFIRDLLHGANVLMTTDWGDFFSKLDDRTVDGFNAVKDHWRDGFKGMFDIMRTFLAALIDRFLSFVQMILDGADKAFGWVPQLGDKLHAAAEDFARFREDVNSQIRGIDSSKTIALKIIPDDKFQAIIASGAGHPAWTGNRALGGPITAGPPGRDWGNYSLMRGEHVWTTGEVSKAGGHAAMYKLRDMAESGALRTITGMAGGGPVGGRQAGVVPEFVNRPEATARTGQILGGVDSLLSQLVMLVKRSAVMLGGNVGKALQWAKSQRGKPYNLGGVGPGSYDCSGFMSAITNVIRGNSPHSRLGSTADFPWRGFASGPDPKGFTIGSTSHYPGSSFGHMAGTLGGVNVESAGGVGVRVGRSARGFRDSGFNEVFHLIGTQGGRGHGADSGALSKAEKWIIRHEAGSLSNVTANNPASSAFGLGQLLEANRIAYARRLGFNSAIERGDTGTTNRDHQIAMMRAYIHDRYGNERRAMAFHKSHGWYGSGLSGGLFTSPTLIGVGERGPERVDVTPVGRGGGRSRSRGPVHVTLDIDGQQVTGILRGLVREEVEDEFRYMGAGA